MKQLMRVATRVCRDLPSNAVFFGVGRNTDPETGETDWDFTGFFPYVEMLRLQEILYGPMVLTRRAGMRLLPDMAGQVQHRKTRTRTYHTPLVVHSFIAIGLAMTGGLHNAGLPAIHSTKAEHCLLLVPTARDLNEANEELWRQQNPGVAVGAAGNLIGQEEHDCFYEGKPNPMFRQARSLHRDQLDHTMLESARFLVMLSNLKRRTRGLIKSQGSTFSPLRIL